MSRTVELFRVFWFFSPHHVDYVIIGSSNYDSIGFRHENLKRVSLMRKGVLPVCVPHCPVTAVSHHYV